MNLDWHFVCRDSAIVSIGAAAIIAAVLRYNPRLFLADFPQALREAMPPKTPGEKRQSLIFGLLLIGWIVGGMLWSAADAAMRLGADFMALAVRTFIVGMSFNLVDWLILDELWLGLMRPAWLLPAGMSAQAVPFEHGKHFRDFLKGSVAFAVLALLAAGAVVFLSGDAIAAEAAHRCIDGAGRDA